MHVVFKQGIKEIAAQQGRSITFMAKPSMSEPGNSCHIHCSLWKDGRNAFAEGKDGQSNGGHTRLFRQFLGGLLKYSPELCYFFGPTINSYKRYQPGSWAPTKMAWSHDNRTVGFRVVGHGNGLRIENRMPGADANPYLALAATIAAGLDGVERGLEPPPRFDGDAYSATELLRIPSTIVEAIDAFAASQLAREAFGPLVHAHLLNTAQQEWAAFGTVVTDWERRRGFVQY